MCRNVMNAIACCYNLAIFMSVCTHVREYFKKISEFLSWIIYLYSEQIRMN